MSGFSGGTGSMVGDLVRQVQGQQGQGQGQPPATQPTAQPQGVGPGEPQSQYSGAYNQQGVYNTLATDMSRGRMGGFGFGGNQFNYSPFGNPYQQQSFGGMFGRGGYGGGWGGPPPPIMGGMNNAMGQYQNMRQSMGPFRGGMMGGGMVGNHQFTGGMGGMGGYGGKPQWGGYGGGFGGGFGRARMF